MSDAAIKKATGCNWERWVWALDRVHADTWPHRKIADYVHEKYKVKDWWTQTVTVGYERIKGLRAIGQRRGGGFEATKSKTFAVPVAKLFRSFLKSLEHKPRSTATNKRVSIAWPDGSLVVVNFAGKGAAKSQAAVQHGKLADRDAALRMKEFWAERLNRLNAIL
jgi:hypothetical protein